MPGFFGCLQLRAELVILNIVLSFVFFGYVLYGMNRMFEDIGAYAFDITHNTSKVINSSLQPIT